MDWNVFKARAEVLPHNNADTLEIIRVGNYQLVSGKGNYKDGEVLIVIPEKSILKNGTMLKEFEKYLTGSAKNRVKSVALRGEVSQGITWPIDKLKESHGERIFDLISAAEMNTDISALMEISQYVKEIPAHLTGQRRGIVLTGSKAKFNSTIYMHDCYQWGAFNTQFQPNENVLITEKIHGSLVSYTGMFDEGKLIKEIVSSKGLLKQGVEIIEDESNLYWRGVRTQNLKSVMEDYVREVVEHMVGPFNGIVTFTGEITPVQAGYDYGAKTEKPRIFLYSVAVNDVQVSYYQLPTWVTLHWAPFLYKGPLDAANVYELCQGKETVTGKEEHIREGCVVTPAYPRLSTKGNFQLFLKVINPAYAKKDKGDSLS